MDTDGGRLGFVSDIQKNIIIAFMKDDLKFSIGKFDKNLSQTQARLKWGELANILNTFPGPKKDWSSWRKTWQDMKSKTKKKVTHARKLGKPSSLNKIQEEIMNIIQMCEEMYGCCDEETFADNEDKIFEDFNDRDRIDDLEEMRDSKEQIKLIFSGSQDEEQLESLNHTKKPINYYQRKITALERIANAKEKSANAKGVIASELQTISVLLNELVNKS